MLLTEDEAKAKWCPFSRVLVTDQAELPVAVNRNNQTGAGGFWKGSKCVASECMAWRWGSDAGQSETDGSVSYEDFDKGCCGLAGGIQE